MRYLVTGEYIESGFSASTERQSDLLQKVILPSWDILMRWEAEGKATGGVSAGERSLVFFLEAASNEEVGEVLAGLPFWTLLRWTVRPIQTIRSAAEGERKALGH